MRTKQDETLADVTTGERDRVDHRIVSDLLPATADGRSETQNSVRVQTYISLGSNLGDRREYLARAVSELKQVLVHTRCSAVYETKPVGYVNQADFLNLVVTGSTELTPLKLLEKLNEIEQKLDRKRDIRYGPRTIDLDILLYGDRYECFSNLQIPHPRMWQRAFVMIPLAELAPLRLGLGGRTMREIAARIAKEGDVRYAGYLP